MRFLPTILSSFAQAYPLVQVEVHCDSSKQLMLRQDLDLTIVTREPGNEVGQLLRQERRVWAAAEGFCPQEQRPMPVALFNTDCFCRAWTCNALEAQGIDYRIAYTSPSLAAIFAIVTAGLAVTAQLQSLITGNIRILGEQDGLPQLPVANVMLVRIANYRLHGRFHHRRVQVITVWERPCVAMGRTAAPNLTTQIPA